MKFLWVTLLAIVGIPLSLYFRKPGLVGIFTLILSLLAAIGVGLLKSVWFGVVMWLVYMSGLMVLFMFFCAMTPNPEFSVPHAVFFTFFGALSIVVGQSIMIYSGNSTEIVLGLPIQLLVLYEGSSSAMIAWLGIFLFFTMIVVVKVAPKVGGSLRKRRGPGGGRGKSR